MKWTDKIKIIVLEDNPADVELILRELKKSELSFTTTIVQTREAFISALNSFVPDIILSDYSLPSFDGASAFAIKKKKYPDVPFIIVSGTIGEENAVELIKNGVTDYVLKDKLFSLNPKILRALKEAKETREKHAADEKLKIQHQKLFEIAILQSHQVRRPVANVLGLINLINFENPNDPNNTEVIRHLRQTTTDFDNIIHEVVKKTNEIMSV
ncbi:MAG TPA: response regulator [Bacteroidia bacterium]|nr:response regulator [Bacteroidia bacterium]